MIAARRRCPPEIWVGCVRPVVVKPHRGQRVRCLFSSLPDRNPGIEQTIGDVVEQRGVFAEEELLEHEPDSARPQCPASCRSDSPATSRP